MITSLHSFKPENAFQALIFVFLSTYYSAYDALDTCKLTLDDQLGDIDSNV